MRSLALALTLLFAAGSAAVACPAHTAGHGDGTASTVAQKPPAQPSQGGQG